VLGRWLWSTNAKDIGTLYFIFALFSAMAGTALSVIVRMELTAPGVQYLAGNHQLFNALVSAHALLMIFFFVMPALMGGFANYLMPVLIGAPDSKGGRKNLVTNSKRSQFGPYLAGKWEGNGHIWIPKTTHSPSGQRDYPELVIAFRLHLEGGGEANYPLVLLLRVMIGGSIFHDLKDHKYTLTIKAIGSLIHVVNIMNGHLRTPKINKFNDLIKWLNNDTGGSIPIHSVDRSPLLGNAWQSGFMDADGHFNIAITSKSTGGKKNQVRSGFEVKQRMVCPHSGESYHEVMTLIAESLGVKLRTTPSSGKTYYRVYAGSEHSWAILSSYLLELPLFGSKRLNFLDAQKCHKMVLEGRHLTEEGREEARALKNGMNNSRTVFQSTHPPGGWMRRVDRGSP
jgi:hypothetical protein